MTKLAFQDLVERLRDWAGSNHDPSSPVKEPVALATEAADMIELWGETIIPDQDTSIAMLEARNKELEAARTAREGDFEDQRATYGQALIDVGVCMGTLDDAAHKLDKIAESARTISKSMQERYSGRIERPVTIEPALLDRLVAAAKIIDNGAKLLDGFDGYADLELAARVKDHVTDCETILKDWPSIK